jgi:uncharacterized protein YhfF
MNGARPGWAIAAAAKGAFDLKLKRALLEEQGIPTFVDSDYANELYGFTQAPLVAWKGPDPFSIMVPESRLAEARETLAAALPAAASADATAVEGASLVLLDWRHRVFTVDGEFPLDYADIAMDDFAYRGEAESGGTLWRFFSSESGGEKYDVAFPAVFAPLAPLLQAFPGLQSAYSRVMLSGFENDTPFREVFGFTDETRWATKLGKLVLSGKKTGTASLLWGYEEEGEEPPAPGDVSIVVDGRGRPLCAIETEFVDIAPFSDVGADFARAEGEGDLSLKYWRKVHRKFFEAELKGGRPFSESAPVVCERFRVVKRFGPG